MGRDACIFSVVWIAYTKVSNHIALLISLTVVCLYLGRSPISSPKVVRLMKIVATFLFILVEHYVSTKVIHVERGGVLGIRVVTSIAEQVY